MTLQLSIEGSPSGVSLADATRSFSEQGGTIGRAADCSWQLEDPERFLSGLHCEISYNGSVFILIDNSTNGTFINGNSDPIGRGGSVPLAEGDVIELGDYKIKVSLWAVSGTTDSGGGSGFANDLEDPFAIPSAAAPFDDLPVASQLDDPFSSSAPLPDTFSLEAEPQETDPLAMLDKQGFGASNLGEPEKVDDIFASTGSSMSDASGLSDAIAWPESKSENQIPEDWGDDFGLLDETPPAPPPAAISAPVEIEPKPLESAGDPFNLSADPLPKSMPLTDRPIQSAPPVPPTSPAPRPAAPVQPAPPAAMPAPSVAGTALDDTLISAMGLNAQALSAEQKREVSQQVGSLMRGVVEGMMQMLRSRASIKNEFRMDVTTIQPAENNPLKFSVDVDEALENMFIRKSSAYKGAEEAFDEGFSGIAEHQMAIIAGIREAFEGMINRFDPENLDKQFSGSKGSIIPGAKNAKNWASYEKYFTQLNNNLDNSFQFLFGDDFVQAYEEQLRKLAIARKQK